MSDCPTLEFWGAAGTVTGSKYLLTVGEKNLGRLWSLSR